MGVEHAWEEKSRISREAEENKQVKERHIERKRQRASKQGSKRWSNKGQQTPNRQFNKLKGWVRQAGSTTIMNRRGDREGAVWPTGMDRQAAKGQLRDKGHREQGETELRSSGDQRGGPAAWGPGTA